MTISECSIILATAWPHYENTYMYVCVVEMRFKSRACTLKHEITLLPHDDRILLLPFEHLPLGGKYLAGTPLQSDDSFSLPSYNYLSPV
mmetsp:Transcript_8882/g.13075  ORF Transcript_8882/g.13075 Transcript_8882/m.13075 type:complete len:89 (-) Transcript_8882:1968-2234(-)